MVMKIFGRVYEVGKPISVETISGTRRRSEFSVMVVDISKNCPIWGVECVVESIQLEDTPEARFAHVKNSFRAGGTYEITFDARDIAEHSDDETKARLISVLVGQWMKGVDVPRLTMEDVRRASESQRLPPHERAERLLRLLVNRSPQVGGFLHLCPDSVARPNGLGQGWTAVNLAALAWSESINDEELNFLTDYLAKLGWITIGRGIDGTYTNYGQLCRVEIPGYSRIEELQTNPDSSKCFVAMWFDISMDEVYEIGIKPAIEDAGYSSSRIDRQEFIGKIDDEIIAEIRRSRFLIADATHGYDGVRGGVYYEAGFAHGLGLPVIFTCRTDMIDKVHFDTRQFNHIVWEDTDDLRLQLRNRIGSVLGDGPNAKDRG